MDEKIQALSRKLYMDSCSMHTAYECNWLQMDVQTHNNPYGSINRYKAHVAKGFHHNMGIDFNDTFSLVIKPAMIRLVLSIAVTHNLVHSASRHTQCIS